MRICKQCGKEVPEDYWLPCCPAPSSCYHRHVRGLPPRKPPEAERHAEPVVPRPPEPTLEPEEPTRPVTPRRGSKHVMAYDLDGLGWRIVSWLRENGATHGRFTKLRTMQNRLSLHRYSYWRTALSYLRQRDVVQIEGKEITLLDDSWENTREVTKPRKYRRRTAWFEEHLPGFLERDRPV
jgi:hypothetical protein